MRKLFIGSLILLGAALPGCADAVQTLPPAIYSHLKRGKELDRVYFNPKFDPATGFTLGSITTQIDETYQGTYADTIQYFPTPLRRLVDPDSPNVLDLVVIDFKINDKFGMGIFGASMKVEGQIKGPDGTLLMAFVTQREETKRETVRADCSGIMDTIAWQLSKDLGPKFRKAAEARAAAASDRAGLPANVILAPKPAKADPAAPQAPAEAMDPKGRLLQLKNLLDQGLITQEEYEAHRAEILKGL